MHRACSFVFSLSFFRLISSSYLQNRIASMECIGEMVHALEPPFVAFFLPGIVSALSRVTTGDFKQGQQVNISSNYTFFSGVRSYFF